MLRRQNKSSPGYPTSRPSIGAQGSTEGPDRCIRRSLLRSLVRNACMDHIEGNVDNRSTPRHTRVEMGPSPFISQHRLQAVVRNNSTTPDTRERQQIWSPERSARNLLVLRELELAMFERMQRASSVSSEATLVN